MPCRSFQGYMTSCVRTKQNLLGIRTRLSPLYSQIQQKHHQYLFTPASVWKKRNQFYTRYVFCLLRTSVIQWLAAVGDTVCSKSINMSNRQTGTVKKLQRWKRIWIYNPGGRRCWSVCALQGDWIKWRQVSEGWAGCNVHSRTRTEGDDSGTSLLILAWKSSQKLGGLSAGFCRLALLFNFEKEIKCSGRLMSLNFFEI